MTDTTIKSMLRYAIERQQPDSLILAAIGRTALGEIERLEAELSYAYMCVDGGFTHGTFDFSLLRKRAAEHVAKLENDHD
jgi:hypothetical protein